MTAPEIPGQLTPRVLRVRVVSFRRCPAEKMRGQMPLAVLSRVPSRITG
jgi:hypothetical protein